MDGLDRLADNPVADRDVRGVLVCNPSPFPATIQPSLPAAWFVKGDPETSRTARASRMFYHQRPWGRDFPGPDARPVGPIHLDPFTWRAIPLEDLPAPPDEPTVSHTIESERTERRELNFAATSTSVRDVGRISSPFHVLSYDVGTGRILSLVDRRQDRELLTGEHGLDFFSFVRERPDPLVDRSRHAYYERNLDREKYDLSCWRDWSSVRERAMRVIDSSVNLGPGRVTFERTIEAAGVTHLVQRVSLLAGDPVIGLEVELELAPDPNPQGIYLAFPLKMNREWQAAFDTAGDFVRLDADQLPGSCRNWVTAESVAAMWDDEGVIALLVPDSPNVQFGDFHFGPPLDSIPRPHNPLLLAWPVNNYWDTNFAQTQPGRIHLRYGFLSLPTADLDEIHRHATTVRQSPIVWPITSGGRQAGTGDLPGSREAQGSGSARR
ncbi:MAG TPA: hypothetical protein VM677_12375 [Actinokineospora sp.]|jgi:hypothetical protein|nr:hypothetical protein [Actinokineospora sp.]